MKLAIPAGYDRDRLRADLLAAIPELHPSLDPGGEIVEAFSIDGNDLTVPDALAPRAQAVLAAPANDKALRDRADAALDTLENAWANWATLTAAQKDGALKLNVRVTAAIARLVLRKLDKT